MATIFLPCTAGFVEFSRGLFQPLFNHFDHFRQFWKLLTIFASWSIWYLGWSTWYFHHMQYEYFLLYSLDKILFWADPLAFSVEKVRRLEKSTPAPALVMLLTNKSYESAQDVVWVFQSWIDIMMLTFEAHPWLGYWSSSSSNLTVAAGDCGRDNEKWALG